MRVLVLAAAIAAFATSAYAQEKAAPAPAAVSAAASSGPATVYAFFDGTNVVPERSKGVVQCGSAGAGACRNLVAGQTEIVFNRNVSACAFSVTAASLRFRSLTVLPSSGGNSNAVLVSSFNEDGVLAATPFYVVVNC